jgi:hypothetical protein
LTILALIGTFLMHYFWWRQGFLGWFFSGSAGLWIAATVLYPSLAVAGRFMRVRSWLFPTLVLAAPFLVFLAYRYYPFIPWTARIRYPRFSRIDGPIINVAFLTGVPLAIVAAVVQSRLALLGERIREAANASRA